MDIVFVFISFVRETGDIVYASSLRLKSRERLVTVEL